MSKIVFVSAENDEFLFDVEIDDDLMNSLHTMAVQRSCDVEQVIMDTLTSALTDAERN